MSVRLGTVLPRRKKGSRRGSPGRSDAWTCGRSLALRGLAALGRCRLGLGLPARGGALRLLLGRHPLLLGLLLFHLRSRRLLLAGLRRLLGRLGRRGRRGRRSLRGLALTLLGR